MKRRRGKKIEGGGNNMKKKRRMTGQNLKSSLRGQGQSLTTIKADFGFILSLGRRAQSNIAPVSKAPHQSNAEWKFHRPSTER